MPKIVELCGSPGVGKTTIYKEINARWKKRYNWIPSHYLGLHVDFRFKLMYKFLSYLPNSSKGRGSAFYRMKMELNKMKMEVRSRFEEQYPEFMDACWNDLSAKQQKTLNGLDLRFHKADQLRRHIEKFQFVSESETNKIAIMEEGLIHLLDVMSFYDKYEEIIQIINMMPLPDALIEIKTDVAENVRRLLQRGEFISSHTSLNSVQLKQVTQRSHERRTLINKVLEEKGIPILVIDAKEPVGANADKIISFIEKL